MHVNQTSIKTYMPMAVNEEDTDSILLNLPELSQLEQDFMNLP